MAKGPSIKVQAARARRRGAGVAKRGARVEWFIDKVSSTIQLTLHQRVKLATAFVKDRVIRNISVPVGKVKGPRGGIVVTERSKKGEYPRADTTLLLKSIFGKIVKSSKTRSEGHIGTPVDYGIILETNKRLDRSFLVKTLAMERARVIKLLSGPIKS